MTDREKGCSRLKVPTLINFIQTLFQVENTFSTLDSTKKAIRRWVKENLGL